MTRVSQQRDLFYIALGFLTRLPIPAGIDFSQQKLNQASRYFSLIGWLIGFCCAFVYWLSTWILPNSVAVLLSMMAGILMTGCFHEDGLADTCDGLGGGWDQAQKLKIMKDSRLGTYGAAALWFALTLKFVLLVQLSEVNSTSVILAILVAHPLSRSISTIMITLLPYVSENTSAKSKPLAESQQPIDLLIGGAIGAVSLVWVPSVAPWLVLILVCYTYLMRCLLENQIQGFTGDCLGASQQISELLIYLVLLIAGTIG